MTRDSNISKMRVLAFIVNLPSVVLTEEQPCYNKFEYEYNVMEQLIILKQKLERQERVSVELKKELNGARKTIDELQNQLSLPDGSSYIRWGRRTCPKDAVLVYEGSAAGGNELFEGAAANTLCLSNKPERDDYIDGFGGGTRIYGVGYWAQGTLPKFNALHDHTVHCVVCRIRHGNVMMVSGQKSCHGGYTLQYSVYLMAGFHGAPGSSEYICMDREPEKRTPGSDDKTGKDFRLTQGECGTLKCPPYVEGREITCAVCFYTSIASVDPLP